MEKLTLAGNIRTQGTKGQLATLRRNGRVPGVLYGLKSGPELVEVGAADLRVILPKRNHVIDLQVDGKSQQVMVKQVERDPIRRDVLHIDFLRVDEVHPVVVQVPIVTHGIPVGVKLQGGVFYVHKKWVKLRAKVNDIPENFAFDVSGMESGKTFYVQDVKFEKGSILTPPRTALHGVGQARAEEELPTPAAAAPAAGATAPGAAAPAAAGDKAAAPAAGDKDKAASAAPGKGEAKGKK